MKNTSHGASRSEILSVLLSLLLDHKYSTHTHTHTHIFIHAHIHTHTQLFSSSIHVKYFYPDYCKCEYCNFVALMFLGGKLLRFGRICCFHFQSSVDKHKYGKSSTRNATVALCEHTSLLLGSNCMTTLCRLSSFSESRYASVTEDTLLQNSTVNFKLQLYQEKDGCVKFAR